MLIVWGTKIQRKSLGWVAEYCVFCHAAQPCRIEALTRQPHFMYLPFGAGIELGRYARCRECRAVTLVSRRYESYLSEAPVDLAELRQRTNPNLTETIAAERELVQRMRNNTASPEERRRAIDRPFLILNPEVEQLKELRLDKELGIGCLSLLGGLLLCSLLSKFVPTSEVTGLLILGALPLMLVLLLTAGRRYMARRVYPSLRSALGPFRASQSELLAALERLKSSGHYIGSKVDVTRLQQP